MHAEYFGNFLSLINGVVADGTVFIKIVGGKIWHESNFIGFSILFIEEVKISVTENKIECEI